MRRLTTEEFINKSSLVHGSKYDYIKSVYLNAKTKVTITCPEHGDFTQLARAHYLNKSGCPKCGKELERENAKNSYLKKKFEGLVQPEDYKLIPLTQGFFAKVDNEDFDRLKDINWHYTQGYASNKTIGFMHRYIMNAPEHLEVDHIWHDTLDNRKSELRLATPTENKRNTKGKSGEFDSKGVSRNGNSWVVYIQNEYIGSFKNKEEALTMYNKEALKRYGEFAYLNKI